MKKVTREPSVIVFMLVCVFGTNSFEQILNKMHITANLINYCDYKNQNHEVLGEETLTLKRKYTDKIILKVSLYSTQKQKKESHFLRILHFQEHSYKVTKINISAVLDP